MTRSGSNDEQVLSKRLRHRDAEAMRILYDKYAGYLTAVCSRYVICDEDVKDVLQESFIKIFTSADKFDYRGEGSLKAWVTRVVVNESLCFLKRSEKFADILYEEELPDVAEEEEEPSVSDVPPEVVHELIRQLPAGYRAVFNLFVMEKKSHKEIAQTLHIKENSSASQLFKAKELLARKIKAYNTMNYGRTVD
ncbi:MAG: sigma-70 family RNA polymerase sigma factor [Bacteroidales bacterium]|nr:sigma-70 family RNA polymerase sigma factor [Bacteroidales bacterium]